MVASTERGLIIHFTNTLENLRGILETKKINFSYCLEPFVWRGEMASHAAHPMACFSEFDLRDLPHKKITYGKYGIGFTRRWARSSGISPVLYVAHNSQAAAALATLLRKRREGCLPPVSDQAVLQVKSFIKNTRGYNPHLKRDGFNFKAENEWRYVPSQADIGDNQISLNASAFRTRKAAYDEGLRGYGLEFTLMDVRRIYLADHSEFVAPPHWTSRYKAKLWVRPWRYAGRRARRKPA